MRLDMTRAAKPVAFGDLLLGPLPRRAETGRSSKDEELGHRVTMMEVEPLGRKLLPTTVAARPFLLAQPLTKPLSPSPPLLATVVRIGVRHCTLPSENRRAGSASRPSVSHSPRPSSLTEPRSVFLLVGLDLLFGALAQRGV